MIVLELFLRAVAALVLLATSLGSAYHVACLGFPRPTQNWLRWTATGIAWGWLAITVFFVLAAVGWFTLPASLFVSVSIFLGLLRWGPEGASQLLQIDLRAAASLIRRIARLPEAWLYLLAAGTFLAHLCRGLLMPPLAWDSLAYHHVFAATWVQQAGIFPLRAAPDFWNFSYAFYPANGEIFSAWVLLPFHSDLALAIAHIPCWFLNLLALAGLTRSLGLPLRAALFLALVAGFTPSQFAYLVSGYVEIPFCAFLTAGSWMTLEAWRKPSLAPFLAASAAYGIALGIKLPAMVPIGFSLPLLLMAFFRCPHRPFLRNALLIAIAILPVAAPWFLRNHLSTGSFSYPIEIRLLGQTISRGSPEHLRFLSGEFHDWKSRHPGFQQTLASELEVAYPSSNATGPALVLAALLAPFGLIRLWKRKQRLFLVLQLCTTLALFAGYWSPPMREIRPVHAESLCRILHPGFQFLLVSAFALIRSNTMTRWLAVPFVILFLFNIGFWLPSSWESGIPGIALGFQILPAFALLFFPWLRRWAFTERPPHADQPLISKRRVALALTCCFLVIPLNEGRSLVRNWFFLNGYDVNPLPHRASPLWTQVDKPASSNGLTPLRIAYSVGWRTSNREWFWYPLFGSQLQNTVDYIPITDDGSLHHFSAEPHPGMHASPLAWLRRLVEKRIDTIILGPPLPFEYVWIQSLPEAFPLRFRKPGMRILGFVPENLPAWMKPSLPLTPNTQN